MPDRANSMTGYVKMSFVLPSILLLALIGFLTHAISLAMCRGVDCLKKHASAIHPEGVYELRDVCAYYGSPTGIGLFRDKEYGGLARDLLGAEYVFFSTEFLFVKFRNMGSKPILVISDRDFSIRSNDELCAEKVLIQVKEQEKLIFLRAS